MDSRFMKVAGCVVTITLIILGIRRLDYIVRPTDTDSAYRRIEVFHSIPKDTVEVMIYGSSHVFLGVDSMELYNKYGVGAYNYGTNGQKINTTKLFMRDSFQTQTPKLAIIDNFFAGTLLQDTNITSESFYVRYLEDSEAKMHFLKQCFGNEPERWLSYYMPLCAFHDNWNSLTRTSFLSLTDGSGNSDANTMKGIRANMGYAPYDAVTKVTIPDQSKADQEEFSEDAVQELDDIVAMCREKGTEVLFITVPCHTVYKNAAAMEEYAQKNGCAYLNLYDYLDQIGLDGNTDYKDAGHLNKSGATKVTDFLGEYITEHYQLTDMRTVKGNPWQKAGSA